MVIESGAALPGNHSFGDHRSPAGTRLDGNIESQTSGGLGRTEKVLENRVTLPVFPKSGKIATMRELMVTYPDLN